MFQRAAAAAGFSPEKMKEEMEARLTPLLNQLKENEAATRQNTKAVDGLRAEVAKLSEALVRRQP